VDCRHSSGRTRGSYQPCPPQVGFSVDRWLIRPRRETTRARPDCWAAGATKLFAEKQSGALSDRPQLRKALAALGEGDVLMVTRLDRLARSTRDLLNVLHEVAQSGAALKSLHDHWADTTTPHGRLILTILGGLAEFERSLIKARTNVGIKRAREAGIRFGRPPKLTRHQQAQALKLLDQGEPQSAVARLLNVDQSTISRLASRVAA
jgi:DNA invertase Pin-like site-specific DNA recombinase